MKKLIEWVCGNVAVKASLELPEGLNPGVATLAGEGLTQILQRKPSSAWEKAEAGYEKRPEGFKRNSIAFSAKSAENLEELFNAALPAGVSVEFVMAEHVGGETKPSKEAEALWTQVQGYPEERFAKACVQLGIDPEAGDDEAGVKACHAYLVEAKRRVAEAAKADLGSVGMTTTIPAVRQ